VLERPEIVIVTRPTELAGLRERFVTDRQVKFYLQRAHVQELVRRRDAAAPTRSAQQSALAAEDLREADQAFGELGERDALYRQALERLRDELDFDLPVRLLERSLVPNFDFGRTSVVVVVGQDGLVANAAKYVGDLPIVAVNPDPSRIDGILLPFRVPQARQAVARVLENKAKERRVTLAEVRLNDGQRMLAFNDFFVGCGSHASARYTLELAGRSEPQSSSGVLVSTGAGSTGWFSSVVNMVRGVGGWLGAGSVEPLQLAWEDRRLAWAVREPFVSKQSEAGMVAGLLDEGQELIVESQMPADGIIFSDGVQADFLQFNTGSIARIGVAQQRARLVVG
jgi:NAD kinase